ncbi:uncharacterized protein LOC115668935 [Syzygium oleosum]|uniref:uncharacterized protein LOC115668935 n=1 Tax=Syzygium oleosum TaxID=219896 RepID=UPI0024BAFFC7|nr:uncharacterized protein LOC115668935 [Syzygium oleosum]
MGKAASPDLARAFAAVGKAASPDLAKAFAAAPAADEAMMALPRAFAVAGEATSPDLARAFVAADEEEVTVPDEVRDMAALSISRRVLRSLGPLGQWRHVGSDGAFFFGRRRLSTSILTPNGEADFPSDLLSKKEVIVSDREIGLYQDLVIPVTNFLGEDKGLMVLAGDVFDVPIRKDIIHRVVRWQLAKRQQGTHSTKTISEVSGTGKKPWRQKGTGRARHGSRRGPHFRGGATMHDPKPRSHAIKINKKVRRLGLKIALSARAGEGKLLVFDDVEIPTHKTKNIVNYVEQMENTKKILVVDGGPINEKLKLATQNQHYVNVLPSIVSLPSGFRFCIVEIDLGRLDIAY